MEIIEIPKHLNPNSSQYKMLMRKKELMTQQNNNSKQVQAPMVNNPVAGKSFGVKEVTTGVSVSGMTSEQSTKPSNTTGSGLKTINLNFRYKPKKPESKKKLINGGKIKLIV
jgi:hypothetical protein